MGKASLLKKASRQTLVALGPSKELLNVAGQDEVSMRTLGQASKLDEQLYGFVAGARCSCCSADLRDITDTVSHSAQILTPRGGRPLVKQGSAACC